jgi:hypothetical protein
MPVANTSARPSPAGGQYILRVGRVGIAPLGQRFSGDGGIVDAQDEGFEQPAVGWYVVTFLQQQNIAWHQFGGGDQHQFAAPHRLDLLRQQLLQSGDGLLGPVLLPERKQAVDQDHAQDRPAQRRHALARRTVLGEEGQPRGKPQNQCEKMGELLGQSQPQRFFTQHCYLVGAKFRQPSRCFARRKPVHAAVEAGKRLFRSKLMDFHVAFGQGPIRGIC